jgi:hypothetical protein
LERRLAVLLALRDLDDELILANTDPEGMRALANPRARASEPGQSSGGEATRAEPPSGGKPMPLESEPLAPAVEACIVDVVVRVRVAADGLGGPRVIEIPVVAE